MKLIVDANILFSLCNVNSVTSKIISTRNIKLVSPSFALIELKKYKEIILEKIREDDFSLIIKRLKEKIEFIDLEIYSKNIIIAKKHLTDQDDIDYLALTLKIPSILWSNDKEMKEQKLITVLNTKELIELLS